MGRVGDRGEEADSSYVLRGVSGGPQSVNGSSNNTEYSYVKTETDVMDRSGPGAVQMATDCPENPVVG